MDEYRDELLIGKIEFSNTIEEVCNGVLGLTNLGYCRIYVYSKEGKHIPHFHIISESSKFECCVCIYSPNYFNHGNKNGSLNAKQRKILNNWLSSPNEKLNYATNWDIIALSFDNANETNFYNKETKQQPNYSNMNSYKGG